MTGLLGFATKAIACAGIAAGGAFVAQSHYDGEVDPISRAAISADTEAAAEAQAGAEIGSETNVAADAGLSAQATGELTLADCSEDCLTLDGLPSLEASAASSGDINVEAEQVLSFDLAAASRAEAEEQGTVEAQGAAVSDGTAAQVGASAETEAEVEGDGDSAGSLAGELSLDAGISVEGNETSGD
jgi:hypothetical protein